LVEALPQFVQRLDPISYIGDALRPTLLPLYPEVPLNTHLKLRVALPAGEGPSVDPAPPRNRRVGKCILCNQESDAFSNIRVDHGFPKNIRFGAHIHPEKPRLEECKGF
jgi:hypothetical protein